MQSPSAQDQAENLRTFFAHGENSVTRERIFFNRFSFDLKIAAARAGYHLHLYEPDVDRDGFDIVVEDQDGGIGWFQLKAVLRSAGTRSWSTTIGFMRPSDHTGAALGFDPPDYGRGGGIVLIEIDDTTPNGDVVYSYTDFRILTALAERYLVELPRKKRGRAPASCQATAEAVLRIVRGGRRTDELKIPRCAFLELSQPDGLLPLMALWSNEVFAPFSIHQAYHAGVTIDEHGQGIVTNDQSIQALGMLRSHMEDLSALLGGQRDLRAFTFISDYAGGAC